MNRNNLYLFHNEVEPWKDNIEQLKKFANNTGFHIVDHPSEANIIASIGGDGTFLQAVRKTGFREDCLYVGVSTGQLGFYCDFTIDQHDEMLQAMQGDALEVRRYPVLSVLIDNESHFLCINECSIRSSIIKTLSLSVYIDDLHFETFQGDGMIISTPTGSTAYNKSANGAVVDPKLSCMQVTELASLNNNQFRTLGSSFLLSEERELKLRINQEGNNYPLISLDNEAFSIRSDKEIKVTLAPQKIKTVKLKNNSFWHKVQRSFL